MATGRFRNWWSLGAVTGIAVVVAWLLYLLWRSSRRDDLATYGAFALPVAVIVVGWAAWAWRRGRIPQLADGAGVGSLDRAADQLAAAVQAQWKKAAEERGLTGADPVRVTWGRPSLPMAGPVSGAAGSRRFGPLPGLVPAGEAELAAGQAADLHALYGGLRSGRLIIAGSPGSGKSGAAVLLVLAALRHRDEVSDRDRPRVPVPVLVTAQDWDPGRQLAADWLARKLQDTYPLFTTPAGAATATALLATGRITVILDGLDEISPALRPVALQALSQQATFRLIVLSRTAEIADAASRHGVLHGAAAVELNPIEPTDAASYLERTQLDPLPPRWQELTRRIQADPDGPLSRALGNPLALTLVRDTYQADDSVGELLDFCDTALDGMPAGQGAEAITGHLLDRVLPAAYTRRPGQPPLPYDLATAQRTLTRIATRMNQDSTRDLNWWQIPAWAPRRPRATAAGLTIGLVVGLVFGLVVGLVERLALGLLYGLAAGLGSGLAVWLEVRRESGTRPRVIRDFRLTKALTQGNLVFGIVAGSLFGLVGLGSGLVAGLLFGLGGGLAGGLASGLADVPRADPDGGSSLNPTTSWHRNRNFRLVVRLTRGFLSGLSSGLFFGLVVALLSGLMVGLVVGLLVGLMVGLMVGLAGGLTDVPRADPDGGNSLNPTTSWHRNRNFGIVVGLALGLLFGLLLGLTFRFVVGLVPGLVAGFGAGLAFGLVFGLQSTESYPLSLASVQLAIEWQTPIRLMRFLDDAHSRNVLRAVGPSYQFRHARLQDRLAATPITHGSNAPAPASQAASPPP